MVFIKEVISSYRAADLVVHISVVTDPLPPNILCFSITGDNPVAWDGRSLICQRGDWFLFSEDAV